MKRSSTRLVFVSLLLMGSLGSAAIATPAVPPASGLPFCIADLTAPELPTFAPSPLPQATGAACGACSESVCLGAHIGNSCSIGLNFRGTCQAAYGNTCPGTITLQCLCWSGPLP
jgi:hypothetical protein